MSLHRLFDIFADSITYSRSNSTESTVSKAIGVLRIWAKSPFLKSLKILGCVKAMGKSRASPEI